MEAAGSTTEQLPQGAPASGGSAAAGNEARGDGKRKRQGDEGGDAAETGQKRAMASTGDKPKLKGGGGGGRSKNPFAGLLVDDDEDEAQQGGGGGGGASVAEQQVIDAQQPQKKKKKKKKKKYVHPEIVINATNMGEGIKLKAVQQCLLAKLTGAMKSTAFNIHGKIDRALVLVVSVRSPRGLPTRRPPRLFQLCRLRADMRTCDTHTEAWPDV